MDIFIYPLSVSHTSCINNYAYKGEFLPNTNVIRRYKMTIYTNLLELNGIYSEWTKDAVPLENQFSQVTALEIDVGVLRNAESIADEINSYYFDNGGTNSVGYIKGMGVIQNCLEEEFDAFVSDYFDRMKDEVDESIAEDRKDEEGDEL
jgi:hypothetical protein